MTAKFAVPELIRAGIVDKLERLAARPTLPDTPAAAAITESLDYVWACSAFAADACLRDAGLLEWLATQGRLLEHVDAEWYAQTADADTPPGRYDDAAFMSALPAAVSLGRSATPLRLRQTGEGFTRSRPSLCQIRTGDLENALLVGALEHRGGEVQPAESELLMDSPGGADQALRREALDDGRG